MGNTTRFCRMQNIRTNNMRSQKGHLIIEGMQETTWEGMMATMKDGNKMWKIM